MKRLTATVSGRVQRVGYRAKVLSLARELSLTGFVQNRPNSQVLLIAEGDTEDLERFASALQIKNALIDVQNIESEFTKGSGAYSSFRKITGPEEVGERLDDGIEILKELVIGVREIAANVNNLTVITTKGFESLNKKMDGMLDKQDQMLDKQDQMLDKQDTTITEIQGMRGDILCHLDQRFERTVDSLTKLKELKAAPQEKRTG
jgi:acylphosphatase